MWKIIDTLLSLIIELLTIVKLIKDIWGKKEETSESATDASEDENRR